MSYNVFPAFAGRGWGIKKRPITRTLIQQADSGAEYRTQRYQYPLYEFDIEIPYLTQADSDTLVGFYNQQGGPFQPFYFSADNDNSVTAQAFGTTDGTTKTFQLSKANGAYWSEPVAGVNGTPAIYANGAQIFQSGTGTPGAPTLGQTAGGSKGARTYYVRIGYLDALTNSSPASAEASLAVGASNLLTVASPAAAPGATSWAIFIGTASGTETLAATLPIGTNYTEPTGTLPSGIGYSAMDYTPYSVSASGLVTLSGAGASGLPLTWSGGYYYLLRFKDDQIEVTQTLSQIYEATTLTLRSVR